MSSGTASEGGISPSGAPRTAFVLPGGATRGASQVGMLLALTEQGIAPDFIVGTSVGAMNGSSYAADASLEGIARLAELWEVARRSQIFPLAPRSIAEHVRERRGYIFPNEGLREWIEAYLQHRRLEDFPIPLHVVATEVGTRAPVILSRGDAVSALLASTAIPGVFPPVVVDGRALCDGGVAADIPLPQAVALGASIVYVLSTFTPERARTPSAWQLLDRVFGRPATIESPPAYPGVTVHHLAAPAFDGNPYSFRSSRRLIDEAHEMTVEHLSALSGANLAT